MLKKDYVAPRVTVVEFRMERGYAESSSFLGRLGLTLDDSGDQGIESRDDGGFWAGNDW